MSKMRSIGIAAMLAGTVLGTSAGAQDIKGAVNTTLTPGVELESSLHFAPKQGANVYRCFQIDTERGSQWDIHISQKKHDNRYLQPGIYAGSSCEGKALEVETKQEYEPRMVGGDWYGTHTKLASGGGIYSIMVAAGAAEDFGRFMITASQVGGAGSAKGALLTNATQASYTTESETRTASTVEADGNKRKAGESFRDCDSGCPTMVVIPKGSFAMGSPASEDGRYGNEGPVHRVTFAQDFAMGETEVTFDQYDKCVADRDCAAAADNGWGRGKRPAINVSWTDARAYAAWLSKKTGARYFLPSESEWEYAARAGTKTPWNTGTAIVTDDANIMNAFKQTVPVGGFPANAWGLKDVHGNVWEWTLDCAEVGYFGVPDNGGAAVTPSCASRVMRGGSYGNEVKDVRSATRGAVAPDTKAPFYGFRVARAL